MKRRFLSILLVLCMLLTSAPIGAFAAAEETGYGGFGLTIKEVVETSTDNFTVTLQKNGGTAQEVTMQSSVNKEDRTHMTFSGSLSGLAQGEYTLTVKGDHYLDYTQTFAINDDRVTVTLYNENSVNYGRSEENGDKLFGVIAIGDVNGDNKIDESDADAIVAAIGKTDTASLKAYDLNGDGAIDMTDLTYAVRNFDGATIATPVRTASSEALMAKASAEAAEGTKATTKVAQTDANGNITGYVEEKVDLKEVLFSATADTVVSLAPAAGDKINDAHPVAVDLDIAGESEPGQTSAATVADAITIVPPVDSDNRITDGSLTVEAAVLDEAGKETADTITITAPLHDSDATPAIRTMAAIMPIADTVDGTTAVESDGTIVVNLGQKVAIKKVSIRVTGTSSGNLADIAKVEFIGDFADRIPEPKLSIPTIDESSVFNTQGEDKSITFSWSRETNVTGYEISITSVGDNSVNIQRTTDDTTYTFLSDEKVARLEAYKTYSLKVRSVSGNWQSEWSKPVEYTIKCTQVPPRPEYLSATSGIGRLNITWRALYDTQTWDLYYRNLTKNETKYQVKAGLTTNSYKLDNLTGGDVYEFYVVAGNEVGKSPASATATGVVLTATGVDMPDYKLVNTDNAQGQALTHIKGYEAQRFNSYLTFYGNGDPVSENATNANIGVIFDNNPSTYFVLTTWDNGASYDSSFYLPRILLDEAVQFDTLRLAPQEGYDGAPFVVKVRYKDAEDNNTVKTVGASMVTKYDSMNRRYYEIRTDYPITTDWFELRTSCYPGTNFTCSELRIYYYDSTLKDAQALFTDSTMTYLKDGVTQDTVDALRERANEVDPVSGETNPQLPTIEIYLKQAEKLLNNQGLGEAVKIHTENTPNADGHLGMAMALSNYQPLGYVAAAGDTVMLYVTDSKGTVAGQTGLKFVVSQYHPEVSSWSKEVQTLNYGLNEITIPQLTSVTKERGGSLYVGYTGGKSTTNDYYVRVQGATEIPMLDVSALTLNGKDSAAAVAAYIDELNAYTAAIESNHEKLHKNSDNVNVQYDYNEKECFLNSTEIVMDSIFYSFPATQVASALKKYAELGYADAAAQLKGTLEAQEQEVELFYQFKGYVKGAADNDTDRYPVQKLNIRYHQMFTGAFMYAGGKHIGIEYDSVPGLICMTPIKANANGKYESGSYSGWGVAHEIGHVINASGYVYAEVTNNIFAQLSQIHDESNEKFRIPYDKIYAAIASGEGANTSDGGVRLGMYWQLHNAYDTNYYSYKVFDSAAEIQNNIFYARVDSYMRNPAKFNNTHSNLSIPLAFDAANKFDNFMRAACAAAEKDMLDFFRAWGYTPDAKTVAFAAQFAKEDRLIQYVDDNSHVYAIEKGAGMSEGTTVTANCTNASNSRITHDNYAELKLSVNGNSNANAILGFEVSRNGKVVAFVPADEDGTATYKDYVKTENNKVLSYSVRAVDRLLKATDAFELAEIKISHDGAIDKSGWTVSDSSLESADDTIYDNADQSCEAGRVYNYEKMFDGNANTSYKGTLAANAYFASFTVDMGKVEQISAVKYTLAAGETFDNVIISVSADGSKWEMAGMISSYSQTSAPISKGNGVYEYYFTDAETPYMQIYDARYIMFTVYDTVKEFSLAELDVLAPTGDNVELEHVGYLEEAYKYADGEGYEVPANAVVFYGTYKGDPSYSVVVLKDANGEIISGDQVILAAVAENGKIGETSDGAWIYWLVNPFTEQIVTKDNVDTFVAEYKEATGVQLDLSSVQAELYRVNDAITMEGQRLTSNTLHYSVSDYAALPKIEFDSTVTDAADRSKGRFDGNADKASYIVSALTAPVAVAAADDYVYEPVVAPVTIVAEDPDAEGEKSYASFSVNTTLNPYALNFRIQVENAEISEVKLDKEKQNQYYGWKLSGSATSTDAATGEEVTTYYADVYVVAKTRGIEGAVTGTVELNDSELDSENHVGNTNVNISINGFDKLNSSYGDESVDASASDSLFYPCRAHEYEEVTVEASCTASGSVTKTCKYCGVSYVEEIIPATDHAWSEWTETSVSCTEDGVKRRTCSNCGEVEEEITPATGHVDTDNDGKCDNCGKNMSPADTCKYCGKVHKGFFGWFVKTFHTIFAFFKKLFK